MKRFLSTLMIFALAIVAAAQSLLPMPEWTDKAAILKGQIVGYADSMNLKVIVAPQMLYDCDVPEVTAKINADGTFEMEVPMYATHQGMPSQIGNWYGIIVLSAGETTEVKLDLTELLKTYPKEDVMHFFMPLVEHPLQFSGAMAELNNEISRFKGREVIYRTYSDENRDKRNGMMSPDDLYKDVIAHRDHDFAWIDTLDFKPQTKEWLKLNARKEAMKLLLAPDDFVSTKHLGKEYLQHVIDPEMNSLMTAYCGNQWTLANRIAFAYYKDTIKVQSVHAEVSRLYEAGVPEENVLAMQDSSRYAYGYELLGGSSGVIQDGMHGEIYSKILENETPFNEVQLAMLNAEENKFMREHFLRRNNALIAELDRRKNDTNYFTVYDTATNSGEEFLAEIGKKFAGKVVLIDLWGTWCGPCRSAIKKFKEHHDALTKKGLVTVYVTDTQSPEEEWRILKNEMHGEHFRLSEKQTQEIFEKFHLIGWPSYLVIDKQGRCVYTRSGYREEEMLNALNKALEE